jgi:hypothetical protein
LAGSIKRRTILKAGAGGFGALGLARLGLTSAARLSPEQAMKYRYLIFPFLMSATFLSANTVLALESIVIEPNQDNTLYEAALDQNDEQFEMSNGFGSYLFAGQTGIDAGFKLRRALLQFDLSANLPADVEIIQVQLSIYQSKAAPDSPPVSMELYRVLQAWGEGASNAFGSEGQGIPAETGDATWHHRIYPDQLWDTAGGVYSNTASASTTVGQDLQHYFWSCDSVLADDLRYWQANPEQNFGWIIVGGEAAGMSAHRFNSRQHGTPELRPQLTIVYQKNDSVFDDGFEDLLNCP